MIKAHCKLAATRFVVLRGKKRFERKVAQLGTTLAYVPAAEFLEEYRLTPLSREIEQLASAYLAGARRVSGATRQDVINGVASYVVARTILEREKGDAITMDCLGALGSSSVSLPCIAWSYMLDQGIPAACEADINASTTHALVQYLFNRPGFQQDPVADTSRGTLIGAHCTCPTRLNGVGKPPEPYDVCHHHGNRDAVPRPIWKMGQRVTVAQLKLAAKEQNTALIVSTGEVVENRSVPPAGGCVVSVELKLDGVSDCLAYPGFHQLFFYGDFKRQLLAYCQLYGIDPIAV
jgi:L-fucose isomerase-like protein